MIKYNIFLLYIIYIIIILMLSIIDVSIILYYIFLFFNVFIYPLFWLTIKIIFYNRTVLLLLLLYYILAKYTIDIGGYKYFYFFGIDVNKYYLKYYNYIWNITAYHIELISIYIFFIVILGPFFFFNKEIVLLLCFLIILLMILRKLYKLRFKLLEWNGSLFRKISSIIFPIFFLLIIFKIMTYQHIKDIFTFYFYFDAWLFNLLEWKIQMYKINSSKDIYTGLLGLHPKWYTLKENIENKLNEKRWEIFLFKKKKMKAKMFNNLELKLNKKKSNYYLYYKNAEWFNFYKYYKLENLKKKIFKNLNKYNYKKYNYRKDVKTWQFYSEKKPNENPVITAEKYFERKVHKVIMLRNYFNFSLLNYYKLNNLLDICTIKKSVYKEPFFEKKNKKVLKLENKKRNIKFNIYEDIKLKRVLDLFNKILNNVKNNKKKFKNNSIILKNNKKEFKDNSIILNKIMEYIIVKKTYNKYKFFRGFSVENLLKIVNDKLNKEYKKFNIAKKYTIIILNKENKINKKYNILLKYPKFIEREKLEKVDNKLLLKTLNKYENEKNYKVNKGKKKESQIIIKRERKSDLVTNSDMGPDLSRRNNK